MTPADPEADRAPKDDPVEAAKAAAAEGGPRTKARAKSAPRRAAAAADASPKMSAIGQRLETMLAQSSLIVAATGDEFCANVIAGQAHDVAAAWDKLAKRNPRVRAVLESMLAGGDYGEVIFATLGLVLPIAAHHGLMSRNLPGLGMFVPKPPTEPDAPAPPQYAPPSPPPASPPSPASGIPSVPIVPNPVEAFGGSGTTESPTGPAAISLPNAGSEIPGADPPPPSRTGNGSGDTPRGAALSLPVS